MRIQIIEKDNQHYNAAHLNWFKVTCDALVSASGAEKLDWLHAETIDFGCDIFLDAISPAQVRVGLVCDDSKALNPKQPLHWVAITALDTTMFDALTQTLLATIGMSCIQSVTGGFSTDWADIKVALFLGTTAYCTVFDWNTSQQTIERLRTDIGQLELPAKVVSCAMLLNQGLRLNQVFENVQSLMSADIISAECLTITNITNSEKIPQINVLMFICNNLTNSTS